MRNLFFSAAFILLAVSCNNKPSASAQSEAAQDTAQTTEAKPAIAAKIDPICEMEYDTSWTEYTVYNSDTVHFCSEHCKTAFLARPEKYTKTKAQ